MNHDNAIIEVACETIRIGERHQKDLGDLESIAASIATDGLLQPIGITEGDELVSGEGRLRAVREILKHATIATRIVRVRSITAGEYAENEIRKNFTASERVDIGKALETQTPERRGSRNPENIPELKGVETREFAAKKAGFGNYKTYAQAKRVVGHSLLTIGQAAALARELRNARSRGGQQ